MKKVIQIFLGIGMAAAGLSSAHAACNFTWNYGVQLRMLNPITEIQPSPSDADGTVLFTTPMVRSSSTSTNFEARECKGEVITLDYAHPHGPYNTMDSGFPGIGIRLTYKRGVTGMPIGYLPQSANPITEDPYTFKYQLLEMNFELVKTGPIPSGTHTITDQMGTFSVSGKPAYGSVPVFVESPTGAKTHPIVVKAHPTCSVSSPSMQVPLGKVALGSFSGLGSTSRESQMFNIQLACSGGDTGLTTDVYTTLTDQTNPANQSDTLSLAAGSTATGVGIQVLSGTTVIKYGPDSATAGNTNQWHAGRTENGSFNIPLRARYVQTASKITTGKANGLATFTMNYQ